MSSKHNILVIEDQPEMAQAISRVLSRAGYETKIATDGFHAGALLASVRPEAITLDLKMPGLDGFEVLEYIRSQPELHDTKVLIISAELDESLDRAIQCGADAVLAKPFQNEELISKINDLIKR